MFEVHFLHRDFLRRARSPVVFCHNDVQGGNVLLRKDASRPDQERVMIIDYEFCGYNYRGYDLVSERQCASASNVCATRSGVPNLWVATQKVPLSVRVAKVLGQNFVA